MKNATTHTKNNIMFYRCNNDMDWTLNEASGDSKSVTGHSADTLLNNKITLGQLISEKFRKKVWDHVQSSLQNRQPYQLNYTIDLQPNSKIIIYEQARGIFSKDDRLIEIEGFMSNVTHVTDTFYYESRETKLDLLTTELISTARQAKNSKRVDQNITSKEIEILIYACQGMGMKQSAKCLNLSPRTVEVYIKNLKSKLCCYSKSQLRDLFYSTSIGPKIVGDQDFVTTSK